MAGEPPAGPPVATVRNEDDFISALARDGAAALAGLGSQRDPARNLTWYAGDVPARGNTAYLRLGKLGDGACTLRFVVRFSTPRGADLHRCSVFVNDNKTGDFTPAADSYEKTSDGSVVQVADIHFDDVRQIVLSMIQGHSVFIRSADGAEISLDRPALDGIRKVLSAYLHLQSQP